MILKQSSGIANPLLSFFLSFFLSLFIYFNSIGLATVVLIEVITANLTINLATTLAEIDGGRESNSNKCHRRRTVPAPLFS
jgi:hypothetical protein